MHIPFDKPQIMFRIRKFCDLGTPIQTYMQRTYVLPLPQTVSTMSRTGHHRKHWSVREQLTEELSITPRDVHRSTASQRCQMLQSLATALWGIYQAKDYTCVRKLFIFSSSSSSSLLYLLSEIGSFSLKASVCASSNSRLLSVDLYLLLPLNLFQFAATKVCVTITCRFIHHDDVQSQFLDVCSMVLLFPFESYYPPIYLHLLD